MIIHGAGAGACVAFAAEDALKEMADVVFVDFSYTKTIGEGADPILTRARHFFEQLPSRFANDARLVVKPVGIRERVKRR